MNGPLVAIKAVTFAVILEPTFPPSFSTSFFISLELSRLESRTKVRPFNGGPLGTGLEIDITNL